jgi:hypothetical protein
MSDGQQKLTTSSFRRGKGETAADWLARLRRVDAAGLSFQLWDAFAAALCVARLLAGGKRKGG